MITGVSGSGKTENAKRVMEFLCQQNSGLQNVADTGPIFEAFGNAKTQENSNSSRFCKLIEVINHALAFQSLTLINSYYFSFNVS